MLAQVIGLLYASYKASDMTEEEALEKVAKDLLIAAVACQSYKYESEAMEKAIKEKSEEILPKFLNLIKEEVEKIKSTLPA